MAFAYRQHRGLDPSGEHRVRRLLGAEAKQAAAIGHVLGFDDLLGGKRRAPERPDLALVHEVGERGQRLLDVSMRVGPVHLVQVDPVGPQPAQAVLDGRLQPPPRVAAAVRSVAHLKVALGGEHDLGPPPAQRLPDDRLGLAVGVHVGRVDEVDPAVERGVDDPRAVGVVGVPDGPEHHRPQAVGADLNPGRAAVATPHVVRRYNLDRTPGQRGTLLR